MLPRFGAITSRLSDHSRASAVIIIPGVMMGRRGRGNRVHASLLH